MVSINLVLEQDEHEIHADMKQLQTILDNTHDYLDHIIIQNPESREGQQLIALFHALDHMQRLHERCDEDLERAVIASTSRELVEARRVLDEQIDNIIDSVERQQFDRSEKVSLNTHQSALQLEADGRNQIYRSAALGEVDIRHATESAEALRWLTRVSRHISRICHYLAKDRFGKP